MKEANRIKAQEQIRNNRVFRGSVENQLGIGI